MQSSLHSVLKSPHPAGKKRRGSEGNSASRRENWRDGLTAFLLYIDGLEETELNAAKEVRKAYYPDSLGALDGIRSEKSGPNLGKGRVHGGEQ